MQSIVKHLRRLGVCWEKVLVDPRVRGRSKRDFGKILQLVFEALVSGSKSLRDVETLSAFMGTRIPDTTIHDLLVQVDASPLKKEIVKGVKQALRSHELKKEELPIRLTVIDGKALSVTDEPVDEYSNRRRRNNRNISVNMALRAFTASSKVKLLLGQMRIPGDTNDCGAFIPFFQELHCAYGRTELLEVISVDSGITSKANAAAIYDKGCHYIMALKDEKSKPVTRLAHELLGALTTPCLATVEEQKDGKTVRRELYRCRTPFIKHWEHAKEFWRIQQTTTYKGKVVVEERYFITSLSPARLSPKQVLKTIRSHWSIENNANWIMDTAFKEDTCPWCNRALELLSLMRIVAYNLVARLKYRRLRSSFHRSLSWKDVLQLIHCTIIQCSTGTRSFVLVP